MFSVVIPTRNSEEALARTLASLVPAAADGFVREVIVADAGSTDGTAVVADATGCLFVAAPAARGEGLAAGARAARRGDWLMFVEPGLVLESGWHRDVAGLVERIGRAGAGRADRAIVFRHARDALGPAARLREAAVRGFAAVSGLPHRSQGLMIARAHYDRIGGHRPLPVLEDVDIARRIGRFNIVSARSRALVVTETAIDAEGVVEKGRRAVSRLLAALRVPPRLLVRLHGVPQAGRPTAE